MTLPGHRGRTVADVRDTSARSAPGLGGPNGTGETRQLAGGLLAGFGGAYYSLAITPNWIDGMTSGAGWIAIALVIFAFWRPELTLAGAYLFGLFSSLGFELQAHQVRLPPELFASLRYVMAVAVLVIVSTGWAKQRLGAPASLGVPYVREER